MTALRFKLSMGLLNIPLNLRDQLRLATKGHLSSKPFKEDYTEGFSVKAALPAFNK